MAIRFGSVCSGIEAASVAWNPLGWEAAWFSEIEPFPCAVLKHHYPDVPNLGDMTTLTARILSGEVEAPDVFCGGTPCQAFSVAGLRKSLADARGNLSLVFCEIADAIDAIRSIQRKRPVTVFWENVPGVLNTKDNAFGCFLAGLVGSDFPLTSEATRWPRAGFVVGPKRSAAWRVLDAQYFGLAQRRKRVFVVASAIGGGLDPTKILFERKGVCGDSEKGGSQRQDAAAFTLGSFAQYREGVGTLKAQGGDIGGGSETLIVGTLTAQDTEKQFANNQAVDTGMLAVEPSVYDMTHACDVIRESDKAPTLQARMGTGGNQIPLVLSQGQGGDVSVSSRVVPTLKTCSNASSRSMPLVLEGKDRIYNSHLSYGVVKEETVCKTLNAQMDNQTDMPLVLSENGSDRTVCVGITPPLKTTTPCYCLAENTISRQLQNGANGKGFLKEKSFTLNATGVHGVCIPINTMIAQGRPSDNGRLGSGIGKDGQPQNTLSATHCHAVCFDGCVRRLTPIECERLMGFPETVELDTNKMTRDEVIVAALINKDIIVDCDNGKVYRTRGGQGKRLDTPIEIKGSLCNGYLVATIHGKTCRKQVRLHRIVWIAKYGIPEDGLIVDHINGIKTDNRITNLQLLSPKENSTKAAEQGFYLTGDDNPCTKISAYMREQLFFDRYTNKMTYSELAEKYGVTKGRIGQIIRQNEYTKIPYKGKPADQCPDSPRYKALGNSWAVPVVQWIGERIDKALKGENPEGVNECTA